MQMLTFWIVPLGAMGHPWPTMFISPPKAEMEPRLEVL